MSNYELYILELFEKPDVVKRADEIREHIDKAFCMDKINAKMRESYKAYLDAVIEDNAESERRFHDERTRKILQNQEEIRKRMEYREACKILFSSIGKKR